MAKYICKRILRIIPVLLVVAVISFFVTHLMPGDPVKLLLGDHASKEQILSMRQQLNLDKPLLTQFGIWFMNMLHGDLGKSLFGNQPVLQMIKTRMEPTILLAIYGQLVGMVIGISLGIIAAFNHGKWADKISIAISLAGISAPSFWVEDGNANKISNDSKCDCPFAPRCEKFSECCMEYQHRYIEVEPNHFVMCCNKHL